MKNLIKISLCFFSCAGFLNAAHAQSDSLYSLTVSTIGESSSDVVRLRALLPHTAILIAQINFALPVAWFIDGDAKKELGLSFRSESMRQKIRKCIEEADTQIQNSRGLLGKQGKGDRFWGIISYWAAAYDTFGSHGNLVVLPEGDPALLRQANQKTFSSLDSLLSDPAQKGRKPVILLWLGFLAKSIEKYADAERYYKMVLDGYTDQPERCIVAEFWLGDTFKGEGKTQQADSVLTGIPKKYSNLSDYSELFFWCSQSSHKK